MRHAYRLLAAALMTALPVMSAHAQSDGNRYGAWTPPGTPGAAQQDARTAELIRELKALVADAEKARAADKVFLGDLKNLIARYESAPQAALLDDDFADGDYTRDPVWQVASGEFWVEKGYGLRSRSQGTAGQSGAQGGGQGGMTKEQLAVSILGAVLSGGQAQGGGAAQPAPAAVAAIESRGRISNAFAVTLDMSSWQAQGRFEMGVVQGLAGAGYRVAYTAGAAPLLELVRVSATGRGVVAAKGIAPLEDKKVHSLEFSRAGDGSMTVAVDGRAVLSGRDNAFRDAFEAVRLESEGADVIVKVVRVTGAR